MVDLIFFDSWVLTQPRENLLYTLTHVYAFYICLCVKYEYIKYPVIEIGYEILSVENYVDWAVFHTNSFSSFSASFSCCPFRSLSETKRVKNFRNIHLKIWNYQSIPMKIVKLYWFYTKHNTNGFIYLCQSEFWRILFRMSIGVSSIDWLFCQSYFFFLSTCGQTGDICKLNPKLQFILNQQKYILSTYMQNARIWEFMLTTIS